MQRYTEVRLFRSAPLGVQVHGDASGRDALILPANGYDGRFTFLQNLRSALFEAGTCFSYIYTRIIANEEKWFDNTIINPLTTII